MTNKFNGAVWKKAADMQDATREAWETSTFATHQTAPHHTAPEMPSSNSRIDAVIAHRVPVIATQWYDMIGTAAIRLGSDASKMRATGELYSATEDQAIEANVRFWGAKEEQ